MVKIAVDAMGGDNAPGEIVAGAVMAAQSREDIQIFLIGKEEVVSEELKKHTYKKEQIEVVNATEVIETEEPPVNAIRTKKDSSIVVGMNMVRRGEADAFCSAGSSGAILVGGQVIVGRIKGVERPPLAPLIPTEKGVSLLIDCGAMSMQDRPIWYSLQRWDPSTWNTWLESRIRVWRSSTSVRRKRRAMLW